MNAAAGAIHRRSTAWRVLSVLAISGLALGITGASMASKKGTAVDLSHAVQTARERPVREGSNPLVGARHNPAIAFDGTNYLVVWSDSRSGGADIYGARVSPSGTILDPDGIRITTAAVAHVTPRVSFDGTNYLVVWEEHQSGGSDIAGARVTPAGSVLDPGGIPISTAPDDQTRPALAFDGTNYLVTWQDRRTGDFDIYGARVTRAGAVLDPSGIAISSEAFSQESPTLAFDGTNYLVAWTDQRSGTLDVYGARVTPAGSVLDPDGIPISADPASYAESPAVAFGGANYLVTWHDTRGGNYDIYGTRVSPSGTVLDPTGFPISTDAHLQYSPELAFDGTNFLVAWTEDFGYGDWNEIGARVTQAGVVLDPNGIPISTAAGSQTSGALAFDGNNYLVA